MTVPQNKRPLNLVWAPNGRDGATHYEWAAPCGCAYHPEPQPHVHECSEHKPAKQEPESDRLFGLKDINGLELRRGDVVRDSDGNEATVKFGQYTHYLDNDDEHGSRAFGVYFNHKSGLYFSEHITPDGTVAVEIVRNRSNGDESGYRKSTVEIPYTGLSPIKQISIKTSDCSGCPYSIPTVPEAFDIETDDMDEATGLMCRKSDRWIGGRNRQYDGPIPDWCELPDAERR